MEPGRDTGMVPYMVPCRESGRGPGMEPGIGPGSEIIEFKK